MTAGPHAVPEPVAKAPYRSGRHRDARVWENSPRRLVPLPPYKIQPLDSLFVNLPGATPEININGIYPVEPDGTINLGPQLGGAVRVTDLATPDAAEQVKQRLMKALGVKPGTARVRLHRSRARVQSHHLVQEVHP